MSLVAQQSINSSWTIIDQPPAISSDVVPDIIDLVHDLGEFDDHLSPARGLVAGMLMSVPMWIGIAYVAYKVLH